MPLLEVMQKRLVAYLTSHISFNCNFHGVKFYDGGVPDELYFGIKMRAAHVPELLKHWRKYPELNFKLDDFPNCGLEPGVISTTMSILFDLPSIERVKAWGWSDDIH
jgi:hypothetical protein